MTGDPEIDRLLAPVFTRKGTQLWLEAPNGQMDGRTPFEELRAKGPDKVRACLEALADGTFT